MQANTCSLLQFSVFFYVSLTGDSFPEGSIDLKCKERVTDSDEENDPADETDGKVNFYRIFQSSCVVVCELNSCFLLYCK